MDAAPATLPKPSEKSLPPIPATPRQIFWRRLRQRRIAMLGAWILILLYGMALLAGFVAPYSFTRQDRQKFFAPPSSLRIRNGWLVVARTESQEGKSVYTTFANETKSVRFFVKGE